MTAYGSPGIGVCPTPSADDGGPVSATGVLQSCVVPPCTGPEQSPPVGALPLVVVCEYHTRQGFGSLLTVYAVYSRPLLSMAPATKSLVVPPACPFDVATWLQVWPPSQAALPSVPLLRVTMYLSS